MPTYRYECDECGHSEEVVQKITADPLDRCPACGSATYHRVIFATGFILKGSGWYKTDYASSPGKNGGGGQKGSEAEKKSSSSDD